MVENGASNSPRTRTVLTSTECGCLPYVSSPTRRIARRSTNLCASWMQMLAAIGETFDPSPTNNPNNSLITGVIVSTRPQFYRLSIWTRLAPGPAEEDPKLRERIESVGRHFKVQVLGYQETQKLGGPLATEVEFQSHKDSEKKGKSVRKIVV